MEKSQQEILNDASTELKNHQEQLQERLHEEKVDKAKAMTVRTDKIRRYLKTGLIHAIKMIIKSGCSIKAAKLRAEHVMDMTLPKQGAKQPLSYSQVQVTPDWYKTYPNVDAFHKAFPFLHFTGPGTYLTEDDTILATMLPPESCGTPLWHALSQWPPECSIKVYVWNSNVADTILAHVAPTRQDDRS